MTTPRLGHAALEDAQRRYEALQSLPPTSPRRANPTHVARIDKNVTTRATVRKALTRIFLLATAASNADHWRIELVLLITVAVGIRLANPRPKPAAAGQPSVAPRAVFDHRTEEPIGDVPCVSRSIGTPRVKNSSLPRLRPTDTAEGSPQFRMPDWDDGRYELRVTAQPSGMRKRSASTST